MKYSIFVLIWIYGAVLANEYKESISFSEPVRKTANWEYLKSYWYGTVISPRQLSLLEQKITLKIYITKPQGLLFYLIDNYYRTLWLEFESNELILNYYQFEMGAVYKPKLDFKKLCNQLENSLVNLEFVVIESKQMLYITCNTKSTEVYYGPANRNIDNIAKERFIVNFQLPIPKFDESYKKNHQTLTHIWIGNVAQLPNDDDSLNPKLFLRNYINFIGCIITMGIGGSGLQSKYVGHKKFEPIQLVSTGYHYGPLLSKKCSFMCTNSRMSCLNQGSCIEKWRNRFQCDCWKTNFIGKLCEQQHCRKFDGSAYATMKIRSAPKKIRFTFNLMGIDRDVNGFNLMSIKFRKNWYLHVFIDPNHYLHLVFDKYEYFQQIQRDEYLDQKLETNRQYLVVMEFTETSLIVKLIFADIRFEFYKKTFELDNKLIVLVDSIQIGSSFSPSLQNLKNFNGTISNLLFWTTDEIQYSWDKNSNYTTLKRCSYLELNHVTTPTVLNIDFTSIPSNNSAVMKENKDGIIITNGFLGIIFIVVISFVVLVIIICFIVLVFRLRYYKQKVDYNPYSPTRKIISQNGSNTLKDSMKFDVNIYENNTNAYNTLPATQRYGYYTTGSLQVPAQQIGNCAQSLTSNCPSPQIPFKPAYKARSLSYSLAAGTRSNASSRNNTLPTLVLPEDFDTVKEVTRSSTPETPINPDLHASSPVIISTNQLTPRKKPHHSSSQVDTPIARSSATLPITTNNNNNDNKNTSHQPQKYSHSCYSVTNDEEPNHTDNISSDTDNDSVLVPPHKFNTMVNQRSVAKVIWKRRRHPSFTLYP